MPTLPKELKEPESIEQNEISKGTKKFLASDAVKIRESFRQKDTDEKEELNKISMALDLLIEEEKKLPEAPDRTPENILQKTKEELHQYYQKYYKNKPIPGLNEKQQKKMEAITDEMNREETKKFIKRALTTPMNVQLSEPPLSLINEQIKSFREAYHDLPKEEQKALSHAVIEYLSSFLEQCDHLAKNPNDTKGMKEVETSLFNLKTAFTNGQTKWTNQQKACVVTGVICVLIVLAALAVTTAGLALPVGAALYGFVHATVGISLLTTIPALATAKAVHAKHEHTMAKSMLNLHQKGGTLTNKIEKDFIQPKRPSPK